MKNAFCFSLTQNLSVVTTSLRRMHSTGTNTANAHSSTAAAQQTSHSSTHAPIRRIRQRKHDRALGVRGHRSDCFLGEGLRLSGQTEQNRRAEALNHVVEAEAVLNVAANKFGLRERKMGARGWWKQRGKEGIM
jgi:hypothetical protein